MFSANESKLSQLVQQQANSFEYHTYVFQQVKLQLKHLKNDNNSINATFQHFRNNTLEVLNDWIKKISSFLYRQLKEKHYLESQMQKSKITQQNMRGQVLKLKQMIQTAIEDYEKQLQDKDEIIKEKNQQIQILIKQLKNYEKGQMKEQSIRIQQSRSSERESLQIIQQQSQHATHSSAAATLRQFREERSQEKVVPQTTTSNICEISCSPVTITPSCHDALQKDIQQQKSQHKRTKTFIDHFRKTIGESFSQKMEEQKQLNSLKELMQPKSKGVPFKSPLREIDMNQNRQSSHYYSHNLKECPKQPIVFKTVYMHEQSSQISKSSSNSDLIIHNEAENINIPKKFETPINLMFFKKKETPINRVMTQPSPQRVSKCENIYFSSKPSTSQKRIFHQKKSSCEKSRSTHSIEDNKSVKSSLSKQKIKITAKMVDEVSHSAKKTNNSKALVYLGGKSIFRKFLLELKNALKHYVVLTGTPKEEIKYQGNRKNGMRWGSGRIIYQNGSIYQGQFKQNKRHGRGSISFNGIEIYEGQWQMDKLNGEGYIKSMKYMSKNCPSIFNEASYCGNLFENKLHGIGTIFLNSKQKIVTKFLSGVPIGDLTYYNFHEIEFGVWPSQ